LGSRVWESGVCRGLPWSKVACGRIAGVSGGLCECREVQRSSGRGEEGLEVLWGEVKSWGCRGGCNGTQILMERSWERGPRCEGK